MADPVPYRLDAVDFDEVFSAKLEEGSIEDVYSDLTYKSMKGKNQLLVGMKGSIENMTVRTAQDGDKIIAGKIINMSNPNTPAQQAVRNRLGAVARHAGALRAFLGLYYRPAGRRENAYTAFTREALNNPAVAAASTDYERARHYLYTNGQLPFYSLVVADPMASDQGDGMAQGSIFYGKITDQEDKPYHSDDDLLTILFFNPTTLDFSVDETSERRDGAGIYNFTVPIPLEGNVLVIPFWRNTGKSNFSQGTAVGAIHAGGSSTSFRTI